MTSLFISTSDIPSISYFPSTSFPCGERSLTVLPYTFNLKRACSAKKCLGLRCSGASPAWKLSFPSADWGKVFVLSTTRTRWRFTAEASVVGGTLWAIFTKQKSVLDEIEESVDKIAEEVQETTKIVVEVAESVEKVSEMIDKDAEKAQALLEKANVPPGNLEEAVEAVRESAKLIEKAAEKMEKLSKVVEKDAEKVDALAQKVESTTEKIREEIDEVFGSSGSSVGDGSKPQAKEHETTDVTNDKIQGRSGTASNPPGSNTPSSLVIADRNGWNPWTSPAQTLLAGNYLDGGIGRIATKVFLMAVTLMIVDILMRGTGSGVQKQWLQWLIRSTTE